MPRWGRGAGHGAWSAATCLLHAPAHPSRPRPGAGGGADHGRGPEDRAERGHRPLRCAASAGAASRLQHMPPLLPSCRPVASQTTSLLPSPAQWPPRAALPTSTRPLPLPPSTAGWRRRRASRRRRRHGASPPAAPPRPSSAPRHSSSWRPPWRSWRRRLQAARTWRGQHPPLLTWLCWPPCCRSSKRCWGRTCSSSLRLSPAGCRPAPRSRSLPPCWVSLRAECGCSWAERAAVFWCGCGHAWFAGLVGMHGWPQCCTP